MIKDCNLKTANIVFIKLYKLSQSKKINNKYLESFKNDLITTIQQKSYFDIKDITPFEWDRMYVILPYTSRTEMHKIVGTKWATANIYIGYLIFDKTWFGGEHPLNYDIFHKLVFVKDNKVILDVTLNRNDADLHKLPVLL